MSTIKPVTVDTVYEAVKSFIETNNILKQVIEDEFCGEFETIVSIKDVAPNLVWLYVDNYDRFTNYITVVSKEQLVELINDFIA